MTKKNNLFFSLKILFKNKNKMYVYRGVTELVAIWPNWFPLKEGILLGIVKLFPVCEQVK
jgi:hypothetical protein